MSTSIPTTLSAGMPNHSVAGILSRTVFQSPIIERILTGRIRRTGRDDAIFVGRDVIHVKEQSYDGHLCTVASMTGFGSRIATAGIIGKRLPPSNAKSEVQGKTKNGASLTVDTLAQPPHSLAVLLDAGELMFLTMSLGAHQDWRFHHTRYPLDLATDHLERWRFIAVEPDSRAMAVASVSGRVSLLALSESLQIKSALRFETGLSILLMDFIFPSASDPSIYLMIVGRKQHKFCCTVYSWDSRQPFTDTEPYCYSLDARQSSSVSSFEISQSCLLSE